MHDTRPVSSIEQRRKLLKGALAASGVVTMGYSGAALASFQCVAQVRIDGGYPAGVNQFTMIQPTVPTGNGKSWAWKPIQVHKYRVDTGTPPPKFIDGFAVNGLIYDVKQPNTQVMGTITQQPDTGQYPRKGWLLTYFTDGGEEAGTYPTYSMAIDGKTPATGSCLTSVNPGLNFDDFIFGG